MTILYQTIEAMTMPFTISLEVTDAVAGRELLAQLSRESLTELRRLESKFSAFQPSSLVSRFQSGDRLGLLDSEFQEVYTLCLLAQRETEGGFNPDFAGNFNPTGLVKGWAIERVFTRILLPYLNRGLVEAVALNGAGDLQVAVAPDNPFTWTIGIEDGTNPSQLISQVTIKNGAVATSGTSKKGRHIKGQGSDLLQVTVVHSSLCQADIWATALLSSGRTKACQLIEQHQLSGLFQDQHAIIYFQNGVIQDA